jgi:indolepyruvate ferredoxin oxidoreductase beta subunit
MTKVLARAALRKGVDVTGAETHGMAQRGGSVVSHLRIGHSGSSLVNAGCAHFLLALEENEAYRNLPFLAENGKMIVNTDTIAFPLEAVRSYLEKKRILCRAVPAGKLAMDLSAPRSANLALLGFMAAFEESPFDLKDLRATIEDVSPERYKTANLNVFNAGAAWVGPRA